MAPRWTIRVNWYKFYKESLLWISRWLFMQNPEQYESNLVGSIFKPVHKELNSLIMFCNVIYYFFSNLGKAPWRVYGCLQDLYFYEYLTILFVIVSKRQSTKIWLKSNIYYLFLLHLRDSAIAEHRKAFYFLEV